MPPVQTLEVPSTSQVVRHWLENRLGRQWPAGHRLPTISQLSRELGVGYVNVQRAVRAMARDGLLVSRRGAGTYVADPLVLPRPIERAAPALVGRAQRCIRGKLIRALLPGRPDDFIVQIVDALVGRLDDCDCTFERGAAPPRSRDLRGRHAEADAIVLLNPDPFPDIYVDEHQLLVVINTAVESPVAMPGRFDVVSVEQEHGGLLAGRRLRQAGVRSACFVGVKLGSGTPPFDATSRARLAGFERGLGLALPPSHKITASSYATANGAAAVEDFLAISPRPLGVFAASDELAVGFVTAAATRGLRPGRDYHIIGFDGQQIARELTPGPLTTVAVPCQQMGTRAVQLLIDRFEDPDQPVRRLHLGCSLLEGATVAPA